MKILYMKWNSYCNNDMIESFTESGSTVIEMDFDKNTARHDAVIEQSIQNSIEDVRPDFIFSFDYFPIISKVCNLMSVNYVAWVYDNPQVTLYSCTLINPCNFVFLFDRATYYEFKNAGIKTVYYMPLAANVKRYDKLFMDTPDDLHNRYSHKVSFVGSLYNEPKNDLYKNLENLPSNLKGYLDAIIISQSSLFGGLLIDSLLKDEMIDEFQKLYPMKPNSDGVESSKWLYTNYVLLRKVTAVERHHMLKILSSIAPIDLYTNDNNYSMPNIINHGVADYDTETPLIFHNSALSLSTTLRSIISGISLRCFEIMASGGVLFTPYQSELLDYFEPNEDFIMYDDLHEMKRKYQKIISGEYDTDHIRKNAREKILNLHTYQHRVSEMLNTISD